MGYMPSTTHLVLQHARIYCEELNINSKCEYSKHQLQKKDVCLALKYSNQRDICSADCESYTDKFAKIISDENLSPEQIYKTSRSAPTSTAFPENINNGEHEEVLTRSTNTLTFLIHASASDSCKEKMAINEKSHQS